MVTTHAAVEVAGLRRSYGDVLAVKEVDFSVDHGEVFALLGPNGAGKTTVIEILEGFRRRDRGSVSVLGLDPAVRATQRALREQIGVVLQELTIEPFLTVREVLERNADFYPAPRAIDEVIEQVGLADKTHARVKTLSGGQQRRLDMALGIIGNPSLIFLDEPTTGFDPSARRGAWELVRELARGGATVILTTHYMDEAEALADRVAVIAKGRIVAEGAPGSLGGRDRGEATIRFQLTDHDGLPEHLGIAIAADPDGAVEVHTDDPVAVLHALTGWALDAGVELAGLTVARPTLEDVYLRLTGDRVELATEDTR